MAEQEETQAQQAQEEVQVEEASILDQLLSKIDTSLPAQKDERDQIGAAIAHVLETVAKSADRPERVDGALIDSYIAELDKKMGLQLDEVLHNEKFQEIESAWRGLYFVVNRTNFLSNIQIEMLDVSKEELAEDFDETADPLAGGLFQQIYTKAYDQYGADPVTLMVANYEFDNKPPDIDLLRNISDVAAVTHCPFFAASSPDFFGWDSFQEVDKITQLEVILDNPKYLNWKSFRESENSRYIGLTLPRFLLRLPYGQEADPVKGFNYEEGVRAEHHDRYLWGNAAFALATNINASFSKNGWPVNIIGPRAGGMVENLPLHTYEVAEGITDYKIPLETEIPDMKERDFAESGFIPFLVHHGKKVQACFFSAYSTQEPKEYDEAAATANSRLSARLPYMILASRLTHYLRVIQRDELGRMLSASQVQAELDKWVKQYVSGPDTRSDELKARKPLQNAQVNVWESADKPGVFNVQLFVTPHYQAEEFNITLSLVAEMPEGQGG